MINNKITSNQLSTIVFLSSVSFVSGFSGSLVSNNIYDSIFSVFISLILGTLLSIPILVLKKNNINPITDLKFSGLKKIILYVYILFFAYSILWDITSLVTVLTNTFFPETPAFLMAFIILAVCFYGAYKGIEAIGRSSLVILVTFAIGIVLVFIGITSKVNFSNTRVMFYNGVADSFNGALAIFSRSTFIPQALILMCFVKEKITIKYISFTAAASLLTFAIIFATILCLGYYADILDFPVYTLTAVASLVPLQRLDIIFGILSIITLCIKVTATMFCIIALSEKSFSKKLSSIITAIIVLAIGLISVFLDHRPLIRSKVLSVGLYFIVSIILGAIIPQIILLAKRSLNK